MAIEDRLLCPECGVKAEPGVPACPECGERWFVEHVGSVRRDSTAAAEQVPQ